MNLLFKKEKMSIDSSSLDCVASPPVDICLSL